MINKFLKKIIAFLISLAIVIVTFIGIIGILFPLLVESTVKVATILSLTISVIGALMILLSLRWPIIPVSSFIRGSGKDDSRRYDIIGSIVIGLCLLVGGLLYGYFKNFNAVIISLLIGIAFIRIGIMILDYNNKKQT